MSSFLRWSVVVAAAWLIAPALEARGQSGTPATETTSQLEQLRSELLELKREYAEGLAALEERLLALEKPDLTPSQVAQEPEIAGPEAPPLPQAEVPAGAAGAGGPSGPLPLYGTAATASKVFNPDIAVIGDFVGAVGRNDVEPQATFQFDEIEATFQAVVDPYARGDVFLTFGPEEIGVEEGFITFTSLPAGLLLKGGKTRFAFGKVNTLHTHQLPWIDRPLIVSNLFASEEGMADAGLSLSKLIDNPFLFLEATAEVYQGDSEGLFENPRSQDLTYVGRLRAYRDVTESANLDLGGSIAYGNNAVGPGFKTRLVGADVTFRWRPLRRAIYERFLARAELVWSRREEQDRRLDAFGTYLTAEYQFARRWFGGARFDYSERGQDPGPADKSISALLTFWPSEFNQIRGQYRHLRLGGGETADEFLFQLLFSIGAHGAHPF